MSQNLDLWDDFDPLAPVPGASGTVENGNKANDTHLPVTATEYDFEPLPFNQVDQGSGWGSSHSNYDCYSPGYAAPPSAKMYSVSPPVQRAPPPMMQRAPSLGMAEQMPSMDMSSLEFGTPNTHAQPNDNNCNNYCSGYYQQPDQQPQPSSTSSYSNYTSQSTTEVPRWPSQRVETAPVVAAQNKPSLGSKVDNLQLLRQYLKDATPVSSHKKIDDALAEHSKSQAQIRAMRISSADAHERNRELSKRLIYTLQTICGSSNVKQALARLRSVAGPAAQVQQQQQQQQQQAPPPVMKTDYKKIQQEKFAQRVKLWNHACKCTLPQCPDPLCTRIKPSVCHQKDLQSRGHPKHVKCSSSCKHCDIYLQLISFSKKHREIAQKSFQVNVQQAPFHFKEDEFAPLPFDVTPVPTKSSLQKRSSFDSYYGNNDSDPFAPIGGHNGPLDFRPANIQNWDHGSYTNKAWGHSDGQAQNYQYAQPLQEMYSYKEEPQLLQAPTPTAASAPLQPHQQQHQQQQQQQVPQNGGELKSRNEAAHDHSMKRRTSSSSDGGHKRQKTLDNPEGVTQALKEEASENCATKPVSPKEDLSSPSENKKDVFEGKEEIEINPAKISTPLTTPVDNQPTEGRTTDRLLCVVCLSRDRTVLFQPCKHISCCDNCAKPVKKCPMCRTTIESTSAIYLS